MHKYVFIFQKKTSLAVKFQQIDAIKLNTMHTVTQPCSLYAPRICSHMDACT